MLKKSKYLSKADVAEPRVFTVRGLQEENVAMQDQAPEMKWCLFVEEDEKPLVLNPVNIELLSQFLGEETDSWVGHKFVLYFDPSIMFKNKLTGGIRVRAPKNRAPIALAKVAPRVAAPAPAARPAPEPADQDGGRVELSDEDPFEV